MRASHCVLLGEPSRGTSDRRWKNLFFFFSRGKETKVTPNDAGLLYEACETTFSSLWIPPLQVNPAVYPQAAPDPFLAFLRSWQEPLTARPSAISQHVLTRFKPSSPLLLFHSVFPFAREVELSFFSSPYEPALPPPPNLMRSYRLLLSSPSPRPGRSFGARQRSTVFLCYFQGLSLDNNCSHSGSPTHQQLHIWGFTFP